MRASCMSVSPSRPTPAPVAPVSFTSLTSRAALVAFAALGIACSSSSSGSTDAGAITNDAGGSTPADAGATGPGEGGGAHVDSGAADAAAEAAADGGAAGSGSLSGSYGNTPIAPIVAAYWIGKPGNPAETGGGPFVYLFSGSVTCSQISAASGWVTTLPSGTQVTELLVGTTATGTAVNAAPHAAAGAVEANYATAPSATEARATSGTVTLTAYMKDVAVDGNVDLTFPMGSAKGTFHAVWCPTGQEF